MHSSESTGVHEYTGGWGGGERLELQDKLMRRIFFCKVTFELLAPYPIPCMTVTMAIQGGLG